LQAASGTLSQGEGDSIRKAVLAIVFKASGLPSDFSEARALMWMRNEGIEDAVRQILAKDKRTLERELTSLTLSTPLHQAILAAKPGLARDTLELGDRLESQFSVKATLARTNFYAPLEKPRNAMALPLSSCWC